MTQKIGPSGTSYWRYNVSLSPASREARIKESLSSGLFQDNIDMFRHFYEPRFSLATRYANHVSVSILELLFSIGIFVHINTSKPNWLMNDFSEIIFDTRTKYSNDFKD